MSKTPKNKPATTAERPTLSNILGREAVKHALRTKYGVLPGEKTAANYAEVARRLGKGTEYYKKVEGFNGQTLHQSHVEDASAELQKSGLLERANEALRNLRGHQPLPEPLAARPKDDIPSRPLEDEEALTLHVPPRSGFVSTAKPTPEEIARYNAKVVGTTLKADNPAAIRPATNETLPVVRGRYKQVRKANRLSDTADSLPEVPHDDGAPLPLADVPGGKTPTSAGHHEVIASMMFKREPAAKIVAALESRGIGSAQAKRQIKAWVDNQRRGLAHVERLARRTTPVAPAVAEAAYSGVRPELQGTRLAAQLKQVLKDLSAPAAGKEAGPLWQAARDSTWGEGSGRASVADSVKAALRGGFPKGIQTGDPYAMVGRRLAAVGHPLANQYNWDTMGRSLKEDNFMKRMAEKHIVGAKEIFDRNDPTEVRKLWGKVIHNFARDKGSMDRGYIDPEGHAKFWTRLRSEYKNEPGSMNLEHDRQWSDRLIHRLTDSMYRQHALADDRETLESIDPKAEPGWRKEIQLGHNTGTVKGIQGNKALKFARAETTP